MKRSVRGGETDRQRERERERERERWMKGEREGANIFLFTLYPLAESLQIEGIFHAALPRASLYCVVFYDVPPGGCRRLKEALDCD